MPDETMREDLLPAAAAKSSQSDSSSRIPELDGLRGLAIVMVLICHYFVPVGPQHSWFVRSGYLFQLGTNGVDLFFVLSGFLIGGILLKSRNSPSYYRSFYIRRFHRIFPVYYTWLILFAVLSLLAPLWGPFWAQKFHTVRPMWIYFLFLQNFLLSPFFYVFAQAYWLWPMWSLAVEEHFYMVMPFIVRKLQIRHLTYFLVALIAFSPVLRAVICELLAGQPNAVLLWTPCRADQLALGVLLAVIWATPDAKNWVVSRISSVYWVVGLTGAGILVFEYLFDAQVKHTYALVMAFERSFVGLFFASLLVVALTRKESHFAKLTRAAFLRRLGRISYCVYIIHLAMKWVASHVLFHKDPEFTDWRYLFVVVLGLALTWIVAELSWRFIEDPLIHRGHRLTSSSSVAAIQTAPSAGVAEGAIAS